MGSQRNSSLKLSDSRPKHRSGASKGDSFTRDINRLYIINNTANTNALATDA